MKNFRKIAVAAVLAFVTALTSFGAVPVQAAGTKTWKSISTSSYNLYDAVNWTEGALLEGDTIVFPGCNAGGQENSTATISIRAVPGVTLGGVTGENSFSCAGTSLSYNILGTIKLKGGSVLNATNINAIDGVLVYDVVSAGGLLVPSSFYSPYGTINFSTAGTLTMNGLVSTSTLTGSIDEIMIGNGGRLLIDSDTSIPTTVVDGSDTPITVACISTYTVDSLICAETTRTISGDITLHGDTYVYVGAKTTANFTGDVSGGTLKPSRESDSTGQLIVNGEVVEVPETSISLDGDSDENIDVYNKETAILNGKRGAVFVHGGGLLKGTGIVKGLLWVSENGTVSPGNSAGKITASHLQEHGTYIAELKDKDSYDQLIVTGRNALDNYSVKIGENAILDLRLLDEYDIKAGDTFMIIDNQADGTVGDKAVSGTFKDLPEGATIKVGDIEFKISYVGGDGNDVVLTALNSGSDGAMIGAPNTGTILLALSNPIVILASGLIVAGLVTKLWRKPAKQR
jgi:hypothetical protein